jgi:hypothetical protein
MPTAAATAVLFALSAVMVSAQQEPPPNAAVLYQQAAEAITVASPSASDAAVPPFPPDSADWRSAAAAEWNASASARKLARQARSATATVWPDNTSYILLTRLLAFNLGDAALYLDIQDRHAEAVEEVRDIFHLADLLQEQRASNKYLARVAIGAEIRELAATRLEQIVAAVPFTHDPANDRDLQTSAARELIPPLLATRKAMELMTDIFGGPPGTPGWAAHGRELDVTLTEIFGRSRAECTFAAVSLACHLYRADTSHWPAQLQDLVPNYLPAIPLDPWSDNTQTYGYLLLSGRLPGGADRPLIYCRDRSVDGLFFRVDQPQFGSYDTDGSDTPAALQKHGGQFRDIVRWPSQTILGGPTTRPLP